ncbi:twin-arginine translocase TatA/TatE family subunit [candidate division KSB1 bacterium]|nr:twin-arginine translocase TatA/TatE family subunit [candidate division KSB1 bacterium]MCH7755571.1 twin-arginine translocase TatA/TatE family subunit [candidate division KSB1 bacterium]MCH8019054.1 twin-arginine translocase TatA/TatE family subunit [candidate division KSB1 bacterium]MCH8956311.1 twin-arginine translocase TatA/TatE family subunit [candidate division KSB1 bacterium]
MGSIGMPELIIIFLVILLLFGSKRLPELAKGLGKGMREFKKATRELRDELDISEIEQDFKKDMNQIDNVQRSKKK